MIYSFEKHIFILLIMEFGFPLMATREVAREKNNPENIKVLIGQIFSFKLFLTFSSPNILEPYFANM